MAESLREQLSVFASKLEAPLLKEIESKAVLTRHDEGEVVAKVGQAIHGIPLVLSGTFKVCTVGEHDHELLLYYIRPGETCAMGLTCWMTTKLSSVKSSAESEGALLTIPGPLADEWMSTYPSWKKFIMSTVLDSFTELVRSIDNMAFRKTDDRLVDYLREKSQLSGSRLINLSHQQIASELGTNRVVVSRLLKKMETDGKLLLYRNQIKLLGDL